MSKSAIPPGAKVVDVRVPNLHERYVDLFGEVTEATGTQPFARPMLAPDNAYGRFLDEVPIPPGRELDGPLEKAWRLPKFGEDYISTGGKAITADGDFSGVYPDTNENRRLILKPKPKVKRVLVREFEIVPDATPLGMAQIAAAQAQWVVINGLGRIEERPA